MSGGEIGLKFEKGVGGKCLRSKVGGLKKALIAQLVVLATTRS